jgi:uncharacterized protein (UPF0333 family)
MRKLIVTLLLILLIVALGALAFTGGGDANGSQTKSATANVHSPGMQATMAANATATYGAEQFHIQLTAMAEEAQPILPVSNPAP